jgi:hypothetical protein
MKRLACIVLAAILCAPFLSAAEEAAKPQQPKIQLVLLLDNSGSMQGLIDQARSQLWSVVNHLARTKKNGQTPRLEVALYSYGNPPATQLLAFTDDLDAVSEKLFSLGISGGDEYCGAVIQTSLNDLKWSDDPGVFKTIFIAGNEPFTQGPIDYQVACEAAAGRGVIVNTIHCGPQQAGAEGKWEDGARLGHGKYLCIDQQRAIVAIAAPQDAEIARLSGDLNKTYVPYGREGATAAARQVAQDAYAATQPAALAAGAPVQRAVSKANALYKNGSWDLVDAVVNDKTVKLDDVKEEDLPESMRSMTQQQRKEHVEAQAKARSDLQKQINTLNTEREKFVAEKRREQAAASGKDTLDAAMLNAVGEQLKTSQFEQPN